MYSRPITDKTITISLQLYRIDHQVVLLQDIQLINKGMAHHQDIQIMNAGIEITQASDLIIMD